MPLGVGIWTVLGFLAVPSDRFISHVLYVVVVCFPVTGSALAVAGRETSAISITFICAGLRPLFHLQHFEEEVGVRGAGVLDFLAKAGTGSLKTLDGNLVQYQFDNLIGIAGKE